MSKELSWCWLTVFCDSKNGLLMILQFYMRLLAIPDQHSQKTHLKSRRINSSRSTKTVEFQIFFMNNYHGLPLKSIKSRGYKKPERERVMIK